MHPSLPTTVATLRQGLRQQLHRGVQLFVACQGRVLADLALGEARPGVPMQPDSLSWWRSAGKPVLAVALAQLKEQNLLDWEDPLVRFVPEFGEHGKEGITLRHLLTHTAGLRTVELIRDDLSWEETLAEICRARPEPGAAPGAQAAYHLRHTWHLLGEVIQRVDGRACQRYVRDEIFLRLGLERSWIGLPPEWIGPYRHWMVQVEPAAAASSEPVKSMEFWNREEGWTKVSPGGNWRGPIRELGRFYAALLKLGRRSDEGKGGILSAAGLRELVQRHRVGLEDRTFRHRLDWGLGFIPNNSHYGIETVPYGYGRHASEAAFGHSGAQCSCAFADPTFDLVVAWACNGLPGEPLHQARARAINEAVYIDLGLARAG